ncbi:MAG: divergent polysaccharide deacetylase family protein [Lentisphaerae bacterium]|nr:MAG: divergent polysaccharide deacetylase family protein [Lentisphaerota bacterium]
MLRFTYFLGISLFFLLSGQAGEGKTGKRVTLYLVIDDVAAPRTEVLFPRFLQAKLPLTFAILPGLANSKRFASELAERGFELILHQPMAPENGFDPGPGAIKVNTSPNEISAILDANLRGLPHIVGMNNHMGSYVTRDRALMRAILEYCRQHRLFFLDSLTSPRSVAGELQKAVGLPQLKRDIFLDHTDTREAVLDQFEKAIRLAQRKGFAVVIGHAWSENTCELLLTLAPRLKREGIDFGLLSQLAQQLRRLPGDQSKSSPKYTPPRRSASRKSP